MAGRRAIPLSVLLLVSHVMQLTSAGVPRTYEPNKSLQSEKLAPLSSVANRDRIDLLGPLGNENPFQSGAGLIPDSSANPILGSGLLGKPGLEGGLNFGQRPGTDLGLGPLQRSGLDLGTNPLQRSGFNLPGLQIPGLQIPGIDLGFNPLQRTGFELGPNPFHRPGFELGPNPFQRPGFEVGPNPFQKPGFDGGFGIGQRPFPELGPGPVQRQPFDFSPGLGPRSGFELDRDVDRLRYPGSPIFRPPFRRPPFPPRGFRFGTALEQLPAQQFIPNGQDARSF